MTTTVRELIEKLQTFDPNLIVGVASDGEGNSVYHFGDVTLARHRPDEDYGYQFSGFIYTEDEEGYEEETEVTAETADAVVIWP